MSRRLLKSKVVQMATARLLSLYLELALRSTRWHFEGQAHLRPFLSGGAVIVASWHERLPLMSTLWLMASRGAPDRRMHVLVSRHRDGRFIGTVLRRFRVSVVHGSSSRGGAAGLRGLLGVLAQGDQVVITPDGPRGPRRIAAPGVAQLAALAGVPVLPCSAQTTRRWQLKSWDRMVIPRPFGRGVVVCLPSITVERADWQAALPAIAAAMTRAVDQADAACPA